jgi:hypothetical protein|tara:strand:+ start:329 stop:736 length:408 start_codon:yes stop_codon:yes gene_type:complete
MDSDQIKQVEENKNEIMKNRFHYMQWFAALSVGRDPCAFHPLPEKYGQCFASVCEDSLAYGVDEATNEGWGKEVVPALFKAAAGFHALRALPVVQDPRVMEHFHHHDHDGRRVVHERCNAGLERLMGMVSASLKP